MMIFILNIKCKSVEQMSHNESTRELVSPALRDPIWKAVQQLSVEDVLCVKILAVDLM